MYRCQEYCFNTLFSSSVSVRSFLVAPFYKLLQVFLVTIEMEIENQWNNHHKNGTEVFSTGNLKPQFQPPLNL